MITNTNSGKLLCRPSSYKKLLDRVVFWIVYIAWRVVYKIAAYNATSVGVGRKNRLFCVCVAETVFLLLLLSVLLCILLWWWCVKIAKWVGPINVNMRFQTLCISPTLKSCLFPIYWLGEIKNSHEPPAVRNFFLCNLFVWKDIQQKRFKK